MTGPDRHAIRAQLRLLASTVEPETAALLNGFTTCQQARLWAERRALARIMPHARNRVYRRRTPRRIGERLGWLLCLLAACLLIPLLEWLDDGEAMP